MTLIYIYIYIYMYTHACIHIHIHTYIYIYIYIYNAYIDHQRMDGVGKQIARSGKLLEGLVVGVLAERGIVEHVVGARVEHDRNYLFLDAFRV